MDFLKTVRICSFMEASSFYLFSFFLGMLSDFLLFHSNNCFPPRIVVFSLKMKNKTSCDIKLYSSIRSAKFLKLLYFIPILSNFLNIPKNSHMVFAESSQLGPFHGYIPPCEKFFPKIVVIFSKPAKISTIRQKSRIFLQNLSKPAKV